MNDTDKLIAAIFAASMIAKEDAPKPREFLAYYDACMAEILTREAAESVLKAERKLDADKKAWG